MSERRVWRAMSRPGARIAASGMIPPPRPLPMTRISGVAELFAGVERSCSRKAARDLVEDQQGAMTPA